MDPHSDSLTSALYSSGPELVASQVSPAPAQAAPLPRWASAVRAAAAAAEGRDAVKSSSWRHRDRGGGEAEVNVRGGEWMMMNSGQHRHRGHRGNKEKEND